MNGQRAAVQLGGNMSRHRRESPIWTWIWVATILAAIVAMALFIGGINVFDLIF
jgi:hypothetical protein